MEEHNVRYIAVTDNIDSRKGLDRLVECAYCGAKLYYCTTNYFEERQDHFVCSNYKSNTGTCSAHFIRTVVLEHLQRTVQYV